MFSEVEHRRIDNLESCLARLLMLLRRLFTRIAQALHTPPLQQFPQCQSLRLAILLFRARRFTNKCINFSRSRIPKSSKSREWGEVVIDTKSPVMEQLKEAPKECGYLHIKTELPGRGQPPDFSPDVKANLIVLPETLIEASKRLDIKRLRVLNCQVHDPLVELICNRFPHMVWLNLHFNSVTDQGVGLIVRRLPKLTVLYLSTNNHITDRGAIIAAAGLPLLEKLFVYGNTWVTMMGLLSSRALMNYEAMLNGVSGAVW